MAGHKAYFKLVGNPGIKHVYSREKIQRLPKSISNLNVSLSHLLESWKENHFEAQHVDPFLCHETKKGRTEMDFFKAY